MPQSMTRGQRWWLTLLLGTISATGPLSIDLYLPALPQMTTQFQTSPAMMQLSITACLVGLALGQIIAGPLSDHYGRKKPLIIGFLVFGLVSFLIALTTNISWLITLRFIQGIAGATGQVLSRAVARDLFAGKRLTQFYSLLNSVNGLFPIIAPIIGAMIIHYIDWQGVFILLALIGIVISAAIVLGLKETLALTDRQTGGVAASFTAMGGLVRNRRFMTMILITGLIYATLFSYISASTFVFQKQFGLSVQAFSFLYAINGVGIVLGSNLPGRLTTRMRDETQLKGTLVAALIVSGVLVSTLCFRPNVWAVAIPIFVLVFLIGSLLTLTVSLIMGRTEKNAGGASAIIGLSQNACGGLASPLVGLGGSSSYAAMAGLIFGCYVLALGLSSWDRRSK